MFPVDSRIGTDYMRGARQFIERIKTAAFAPMHFGEDYRGGNAFQPLPKPKDADFSASRTEEKVSNYHEF